MQHSISVFWFRRDLRLNDNHGLFRALKSGSPVLPVFIFDDEIIEKLPRRDARVEFIQREIERLDGELRAAGSSLHTFRGTAYQVWKKIFAEFKVRSIYCNEDYEPYALKRDEAIAQLAADNGANFYALKDQVIFAKNEVVKDDGQPYKVFTPYAKKWKAILKKAPIEHYPSERNLKSLDRAQANRVPWLRELGFEATGAEFPSPKFNRDRIKRYGKTRDQLGEPEGTSRLGLHLRFGTISIRKLVAFAQPLSDVFVNELIWREFFMQILYHFPHSASEPFDPRYAKIKWRNNESEFQKWCAGETGYPLVDAAMHQINATGFMHNRARMVVASFLTKHLLIDWRWGEKYFAEKLLDYEMSSNVGNWQWAAGCGCDAAPYFRVFNPSLQAKRFDPKGQYIARWRGEQNLEPLVEHAAGRTRALAVYKKALGVSK